MNLELNGKRALITGSYRGTGAGLARVRAAGGPGQVGGGRGPGGGRAKGLLARELY